MKMRLLVYSALLIFLASCSKEHDYGVDSECEIAEGTRIIWFDWGMDSTAFIAIDTLSIHKDIAVNNTVYKTKSDKGDRYLFKLKDLGFTFKNGQKLDDLSICFIEYQSIDSLDYVHSDGFMIGYEDASIQKKSDQIYVFKAVAKDVENYKTISGSFPNKGIIWIDTEILFRIKE